MVFGSWLFLLCDCLRLLLSFEDLKCRENPVMACKTVTEPETTTQKKATHSLSSSFAQCNRVKCPHIKVEYNLFADILNNYLWMRWGSCFFIFIFICLFCLKNHWQCNAELVLGKINLISRRVFLAEELMESAKKYFQMKFYISVSHQNLISWMCIKSKGKNIMQKKNV